jgi:hypothetical protein
MSKSELQKVVLICVPFALFLFCMIGAYHILPENCYLFDDRIMGLMCDGIDLKTPKPCPVCEDQSITSAAQIIFILGFGFLFLPFIVYAIKGWQNLSENQPELFG